MKITLKSIVAGLCHTNDGDIILVETHQMILQYYLDKFHKRAIDQPDKYAMQYKRAKDHHAALCVVTQTGVIPDEEDNPKEYVAMKEAMTWMIENIDQFWI